MITDYVEKIYNDYKLYGIMPFMIKNEPIVIDTDNNGSYIKANYTVFKNSIYYSVQDVDKYEEIKFELNENSTIELNGYKFFPAYNDRNRNIILIEV